MDDRKQCGGIFQEWSTYTAFPVQLIWYSKVGFQADWNFCLISRVLSVWLDGLEVDGSRSIGENDFSVLVRFWYCSTGMLSVYCLSSLKSKGEETEVVLKLKYGNTWILSEMRQRTVSAQGVERMGKENERNRSEDGEKILVVLRLKMCISKQRETLSVSGTLQKARWVWWRWWEEWNRFSGVWS